MQDMNTLPDHYKIQDGVSYSVVNMDSENLVIF